MRLKVDIDGGPCGNRTEAVLTSDDGMFVAFDIKSTCDKMNILAALMTHRGPLDARNELDQKAEGEVLRAVRSELVNGCTECAVPVALLRGMQVAVGLAQQKDIQVRFEREGA